MNKIPFRISRGWTRSRVDNVSWFFSYHSDVPVLSGIYIRPFKFYRPIGRSECTLESTSDFAIIITDSVEDIVGI